MGSESLEQLIVRDRILYADGFRRAMIGGYALAGTLYTAAAVSLVSDRPGITLITAGVGAFFHNEASDDRAQYQRHMIEATPEAVSKLFHDTTSPE